jgi:polysaccharide export outer membrane protein
MPIRRLFILTLLWVCSTPAFSAAQYTLSSGDSISINVVGETELTFKKIVLNDAGAFSYPFIGEVMAKGLTEGQVEQLIASRLKNGYLVDPRVSVSVLEYRPFYIGGEVKSPGGYAFKPGLTMDRAIALAGGLTERASDKRISIIRGKDPSRAAAKASLNTLVEPGDTINIDQGFF